MKRSVAAIIQARYASTRLPGKVLASIAGRPMVQRVIERARQATRIDTVVLATTVDASDAPVSAAAAAAGAQVFRGSVDDVLDRYRKAARAVGARVIVRITADNPLLDPRLVDRVVGVFLEGGCDYVSNLYPKPTFPDGLDVEVFSADALDRAAREASSRSEREHVTPYMYNHPERFRLRGVSHDEDLSNLRWTVDEEQDLQFVREVYRHLDDGSGRRFGMEDILQLLKRHPELTRINAGIGRNEGYAESLREDHAG